MKKSFFRKILNIIFSLAIVSQSLTPYVVLLPQTASAQTVDETTVAPTPTPIESGQADTITATPTDTVTPVPTDVPAEEITPASNAADATPTVTPVDNLSPPAGGQVQGDSTLASPTASEGQAPEAATGDEQLNIIVLDNVSAPTIDLGVVVSEGSAALLTTDKPDYAPTDTALITGSNLLPNTTYTLRVWSDDEPPTSTTVEVTSDENGVFAYAYQLDGTYRPNYSAELRDSEGNVVASTTFTDSDSTFKSPTAEGGNENDWLNGDRAFSSNDSWATETSESDDQSYENFGFSIPAGSTINGIEVKIEAKSSDTTGCAIQPRLWSDSDNNTSNRKSLELTGTDAIYTFGASNDLWGATWTASDFTDANFYAEFQYDDFSGNNCADSGTTVSVDHIQVKVTYTEPLASNLVWPTNWTTPSACTTDPANDENPSSTDIIGDGSNPAVGFASDANYQYFRERLSGNPAGSGGYDQFAWVTLFQTSTPQYQYLGSLNGLDEKVQLYANTVNSPDSSGVDFSPLFNDPADSVAVWEGSAGSYARIVNAGGGVYYVDWAIPLTELTSRGITNSITKFFATSANANNYNKDHLNCYEAIADLSIIKSDSPDPVTSGETLTYTLTINNGGPDTATGVVVNDTLPAGYSVTSVTPSQGSCSDTTAPTIQCELGTINNGGSASVTIVGTIVGLGTVTNNASVGSTTLDTNTSNNSDSEDTTIQQALGTLVVHKTFTDQHSNVGITINITGTATGSAQTNGSGDATFSNLNPGTYSATAVEPSGYYQSGTTCSNVSVVGGQTTNCTITDSPIKGTITVHKTIIGTSTNLSQFCFTLSSDPGNGEVCADFQTGDAVFDDVPFGTYSATETDSPPDYTEQSNDCEGLAIVGDGDSKSCTVTNSRDQGTITVVKDLVPSDNSGLFNLQIDDSTVGTGENVGDEGTTGQITVDTGNYTVGETAGTDTDLSNYTSSISCDNDESGEGTSLEITVNKGNNIICTITNTRNRGDLLVHKLVDTNGDGTYDVDTDSEANALDLGFGWNLDNSNTFNGFGTPATILDTGDYDVYENNNVTDYHFVGWFQGEGSCEQRELNDSLTANITVSTNQTTEVTFCNARDTGTITIDKVTNPEEDPTVFDINLTQEETNIHTSSLSDTDELGTYTVLSGTYELSEETVPGWDLTDAICTVNDEEYDFDPRDESLEVNDGDNIYCTFTNTKRGEIIVTKYQDNNENGVRDEGESTLEGWLMHLSQGEDFSDNETTNALGIATFDNLPTGTYTLSEPERAGWTLTNIVCSNERQEVNDTSNEHSVSVSAGETVTCEVGNHSTTPILTISKFNDAAGDKSPGNTVGFTITIAADSEGGPADNVQVVDLLPQGFVFNPSSWKVVSSDTTRGVSGDITSLLTAPTYASPGTWSLGHMNSGETLTLSYTTTIDGSQATGTYYDNAWGQGNPVGNSTVIFARAIDPGDLDPSVDPSEFVGTQVSIINPNQPGVDYKATSTQEVLGASTFLPATGENTLWVIIATLLSGLGLGSLLLGFKLRRKYA